MTSQAALEFHTLRVADIEELTDDAVAITFEVPPEVTNVFSYLPGQHVTVRAMIDGRDVRRSYSICAKPAPGSLRIGIKRLTGGAFSAYATTVLSPGEVLDVMPPVGDFTIQLDGSAANHYAGIAAGSGITPVLSLLSSVLDAEPNSRFTLLYGNQRVSSIMFLDELEGLKDRHPDRFHLIHVLSREELSTPLFSGRLNAKRLDALFDSLVDVGTVDSWFLCGPFGMVEDARRALAARDVEESQIRDELFFAGPPDTQSLPPLPEGEDEGTVDVTITLNGRSSQLKMRPETSILDAALRVRGELPFSCKGGMCASCKARLVEGEVTMDKNWALVEEDLAKGFVLTCQSHPTTSTLVVDYDV